jgi:hypothetical protein
MRNRDLTTKELGLLRYLYPDVDPEFHRMHSMQKCRRDRAARQTATKKAAKNGAKESS